MHQGPLSASSSVAVANSGSISTVVRRSSPRLLSSFNTDDDANDKAPAAAKDEEATSAAAVKEEEPPRKKTRGRPRKNPAAAAADVKGKRPTRASAAAAVTTLSVTASSFKEESSSTSTSSRPRRRRTSKDSEASDGSQESDITAVAMKMEVEAELEAVSLPPSWERRLQEGEKGITFVYGVDEAGRGPLAGPVVAAACHIPSDLVVPGIQVRVCARVSVKDGGICRSVLVVLVLLFREGESVFGVCCQRGVLAAGSTHHVFRACSSATSHQLNHNIFLLRVVSSGIPHTGQQGSRRRRAGGRVRRHCGRRASWGAVGGADCGPRPN